MFPGIGTVINILTVTAGSLLGLLVGARLPANINQLVMQALATVTLLVGLQMALTAGGGAVIVVLMGLVSGAALGEAVNIQRYFDALGQWLQARLAARSPLFSRFTEGFVTASMLFCVGPMTVLGAIQDGLMGDPTILITKAALDGIAAMALAAALGIGVLFSVFTIGIYQGGLTAAAGLVRGLVSDPILDAVTAAGGLMIVALAFNMLGLTKIRVANLLPALLTTALLAALVQAWGLPAF